MEVVHPDLLEGINEHDEALHVDTVFVATVQQQILGVSRKSDGKKSFITSICC